MRFFSPEARLFGLQVWPRRLSDAEYIERIRRQLKVARWFRYLTAVMGVGVIVMSIWAIQMFVKVLNGPLGLGQQNFVNAAFGAAIIMGLSIGFWMGSMIHSVGVSFVGHRQERLLVECWDMLHKLIAERFPDGSDAEFSSYPSDENDVDE